LSRELERMKGGVKLTVEHLDAVVARGAVLGARWAEDVARLAMLVPKQHIEMIPA
jgi:hypothetical protein